MHRKYEFVDFFKKHMFNSRLLYRFLLRKELNIILSVVSQSFLIDRAGRKKLMGYGYLLMGVTMCVLTVTLSIKVKPVTRCSSSPHCLIENRF